MAFFDNYLRYERARIAKYYIKPGDILLDVCCYDGYFMNKVKGIISKGYGIDELSTDKEQDNLTFKKFRIEKKLPFKSNFFDSAVMLAVLEHIPYKEAIAKELYRVLKDGGRVIITVPSTNANSLLYFLAKIKVIEEEDFLEQHNIPVHEEILGMFERAGFKLTVHKKFQLGYNNLYVFEKKL